ncbi:MAG TPA: hypothetical protein VF895_00285 [Gaiellaceae bacterium]
MKLWQRIRASWRKSRQREDELAVEELMREREEQERKRLRDPSIETFDTKNAVP